MLRNRVLLVWLAFLLLYTQQGMALHALGHAIEDTRGGQRQTDSRAGKQQPDEGHRHVCEHCVAYAPMGAAAPPSGFDFTAVAAASQAVRSSFLCFASRQPLAAYHSRAPPHILV
jgi:hypothetical protein